MFKTINLLKAGLQLSRAYLYYKCAKNGAPSWVYMQIVVVPNNRLKA